MKRTSKKELLLRECATMQCKLFAVYNKDIKYYNDENLKRWYNRFKTSSLYAITHVGNHITIGDLENEMELLIDNYNHLSDEEKLIYEIL